MPREIHLWIDDDTDPNASWIVSIDDESSSSTCAVLPSNMEGQATIYAVDLGRYKNLPVFKVDSNGNKIALKV